MLYKFDKFRLDVSERILWRENERLALSEKAFDTLSALVRRGNHLISKDELLTEVWADAIVEQNNLDKNISILRRVLGERTGQGKFIETVRGHGFRFVPEVVKVTEVLNSESESPAPGESKIDNEAQNKSDPETRDLKSETNQERKSFASNRTKKHFSYAGLAFLVMLGIGTAGLYRWKNSTNLISDSKIKTLAVLPFKPLVIENRNETLELGMADTLISKLSGSEEIVVRPMSAVRRYDSVEQDALTAGRELGVESVLDGMIQTWGDRIRISAKLIRTSDGKQLWTGQFDEKFTDLFSVQDSISERAAEALKIRLGSHEKKHDTENVEAYQLYMKGRYHLAKTTPPDINTSISFFQQAIDIDPEYALAYTGLSKAYGVLAIFGEMPAAEAFPLAKAAGHKAIKLDDRLSEAHNSLCMEIFWHDWDWDAAEKECLKSLQIDPYNADSHGYYAIILSNTGRHPEALAEARRARELNPLDLSINALEGQYLLHAGRPDEALIQLQKTSELEPGFPIPHLFAASAYIEKGMFAEAIAESAKEYELSGRNDVPFGAYALAKSGRRAEAQAELDKLLKLSKTKYVPPYNIALIYNALDKRDKALEWLENAFHRRDPKMTFLKVEPKWNNLRNEPRFIDLMKRMKL